MKYKNELERAFRVLVRSFPDIIDITFWGKMKKDRKNMYRIIEIMDLTVNSTKDDELLCIQNRAISCVAIALYGEKGEDLDEKLFRMILKGLESSFEKAASDLAVETYFMDYLKPQHKLALCKKISKNDKILFSVLSFFMSILDYEINEYNCKDVIDTLYNFRFGSKKTLRMFEDYFWRAGVLLEEIGQPYNSYYIIMACFFLSGRII